MNLATEAKRGCRIVDCYQTGAVPVVVDLKGKETSPVLLSICITRHVSPIRQFYAMKNYGICYGVWHHFIFLHKPKPIHKCRSVVVVGRTDREVEEPLHCTGGSWFGG
jgi:hypothetical protein